MTCRACGRDVTLIDGYICGLCQSSGWESIRKKPVVVAARQIDERTEIDTREGTVVAEPGDYVIRGVEGEEYPIDPDILDETYDFLPVDE